MEHQYLAPEERNFIFCLAFFQLLENYRDVFYKQQFDSFFIISQQTSVREKRFEKFRERQSCRMSPQISYSLFPEQREEEKMESSLNCFPISQKIPFFRFKYQKLEISKPKILEKWRLLNFIEISMLYSIGCLEIFIFLNFSAKRTAFINWVIICKNCRGIGITNSP